MADDTDTIIAGAGPAGLAVAAVLRRASVPFILLERTPDVGGAWRRHYESLRLHTAKRFSALPFKPYPRDYPRYVPRLQFIAYLEDYARTFDLRPLTGVEVQRIQPINGGWKTSTNTGTYQSRRVVLATGAYSIPRRPEYPGQQSFTGTILHSADYVNGAPFDGQRVLIVGLGSSAGEIAVDLHRNGARVTLSLRSPVTIVPLEVLGVPNTAFALACRGLPPRLADLVNAPVIRLWIGDLSRYGIRKRKDGPFTEMYREWHVPVVDVGVVGLVKRGEVAVRPAIERLDGPDVVFDDGQRETFDAIVLATGYESGLRALLGADSPVLDAEGRPVVLGGGSPLPGLYLCGSRNVPTGLLREIGIEARRIGTWIERDRAKEAASPQ